jgi:hypothetical protein
MWPVASWRGRLPKSTGNGFTDAHKGVDIMFAATPDDPPWPGRDNAARSRRHYMPEGVPVLAALPGRVVNASRQRGGFGVRLAHADGLHTLYLHMATLKVRKGQRVEQGEQLGEVGGSPLPGPHLRHLHFETWRNPRAGRYVRGQMGEFDPLPLLTGASAVPFDPPQEGLSHG